MRQKQAAEAKLLAAHNKQRVGVLKEHEKLRAAEAANKKANVDRLKKLNTTVDQGDKHLDTI